MKLNTIKFVNIVIPKHNCWHDWGLKCLHLNMAATWPAGHQTCMFLPIKNRTDVSFVYMCIDQTVETCSVVRSQQKNMLHYLQTINNYVFFFRVCCRCNSQPHISFFKSSKLNLFFPWHVLFQERASSPRKKLMLHYRHIQRSRRKTTEG